MGLLDYPAGSAIQVMLPGVPAADVTLVSEMVKPVAVMLWAVAVKRPFDGVQTAIGAALNRPVGKVTDMEALPPAATLEL